MPHEYATAPPLLGPDDPAPVRVHPGAGSPFLLVADHAGRRVPARLGDLGVGAADWDRHIAWDIGIAGVCAALAPLLGATWIEQAYSRLVIDCNRRPGHSTSIPQVSDGTAVPGNAGLDHGAQEARDREIFRPYHAAIAAEIDTRLTAGGQRTVLIAMHSFTPTMGGIARPWHLGVLFNRHADLSLALAALLRDAGWHVGENEPYSLGDDSDFSVPVHAEARGLAYVELEIRQDLIAAPIGQLAWAQILADALPRALLQADTAAQAASARKFVRAPKVECMITFLSREKGGRSTLPIVNDGRYRTLLQLESPTRSELFGVHFVSGPSTIAFGVEAMVELHTVIYPNPAYDQLQPGCSFAIREGDRIVGRGYVVRRVPN